MSLILCLILLNSVLVSCNKPNIVFILADDLGWDDVSFHGSQQIPTPNIDSLAANGILLNNYYVQPICTPSRAALMTGRHPIELGLQHDVIVGAQPYGLGLNETILPQYLQTLGYKTHIVGKWHLGFFAKEYTPMYRGFDSHYGYYQGCEDYWDHSLMQGPVNASMGWGLDFWNGENVERSAFGQYSTEIFTKEALKIITEHNKSNSLFLYLPFQAVHSGNPGNPVRLQAPWEYVKNFLHIKSESRRNFAAMVSALDDAVGKILMSLKFNGLLQNSVVVFSTDNGGPANHQNYNAACNWPLRGSKRTMWEGGVRGNGIIWSAHLNKSNYVSNHMMQITDWVPTLLEAAGYDMSKLPGNLYGISQWQALSNNQEGPRKEMLHNFDPINGDGAFRQGHLKVVYGGGDTQKYNGWFPPDDLLLTTSDNHRFYQDSLLEYNSTFRSISQILNEADKFKVSPVSIIDCSPGHGNLSDCQPWLKPCLFNITADPCEYHDLARKYPEVVDKMMTRVREYTAYAVTPLNKPNDPLGWPGLHSGIWKPWVTL